MGKVGIQIPTSFNKKMSRKREAFTCFKYPEYSYDEKKCNDFIKHFFNFSVHINNELLKANNFYFGYDLCESAAYDGCFKSYLYIEKENIKNYKIQKGLVRKGSSWAFWKLAVTFGYIPHESRVFFPSSFVNFEEYFKDSEEKSDIYQKIDANILNSLIKDLPDREMEIIQMYLGGYNFSEIANRIHKGKTPILKQFKRTVEKIKRKVEKPFLFCKECLKKFPNNGNSKIKNFCSKKCRVKMTAREYYQKKRKLVA